MTNQARPLSDRAVVPKNLLLQAIACLEQYPRDPMAKMLRQQMLYALQEQTDEQP
jgi:hypothetical protein